MEKWEYLNYHIRKLDNELKVLGTADSSIEYSGHIRPHFDNIITRLNILKEAMDMEDEVIEDYEWYFGKESKE